MPAGSASFISLQQQLADHPQLSRLSSSINNNNNNNNGIQQLLCSSSSNSYNNDIAADGFRGATLCHHQQKLKGCNETSFYVNCDFFGTGSNLTGNYEARSEKMAAKYEFERVKKLHEVTKPESSRLVESGAGLPEGTTLAPATTTSSLKEAALRCAKDDMCKAVCRGENNGETHVLRGYLTGYKDEKAKGPWRCLAFEGEEPFGFDDVQPCFRGLSEVTNGSWTSDHIIRAHLPVKVPGETPEVIMLEPNAPQPAANSEAANAEEAGKTAEADSNKFDATSAAWTLQKYAAANLEPRYADSLASAQAQCTTEEGCEAVCYHESTGRMLFYGNIGAAEVKVENWKEMLEPASSAETWLGNPPQEEQESSSSFFSWFSTKKKKKEAPKKTFSEGWQCSLSNQSCLADEKIKQHHLRDAERARRLDRRREHRLELAALSAPSGNAPVALGPALGLEFWGQIKNVVGEEARQWTQDCADLRPLLAGAKLDAENFPSSCSAGMTYVRRRYGYWLQCCADAKTSATTCRPMLEDARTSCGAKVCDPFSVCLKEVPKKGTLKAKTGTCVKLGSLGQAKSSSGKIFEVTGSLSEDTLLTLYALTSLGARSLPQSKDDSSWREFL